MSSYTTGAFDETNDVYDPATLTTNPRRRQQLAASNIAPSSLDPLRPQSAHSTRGLRRSPRTIPHLRAVSAGEQRREQNPAQVESIPVSVHSPPDPSGIAGLTPALSEARTESDGSSPDNLFPTFGSSYWPRRSTTVSPRTASAIHFALEEAIRKPISFTLDWDEVNASMSDLVGVSAAPGLPPAARAQNGASRATQGTVPVNPHAQSGVRTPTEIMRQRRDREARRKAEQEARQEQEELERRRQQEQAQQSYAAGVAGDRTRRPNVRTDAQPATTFQQPQQQIQVSESAAGQNNVPKQQNQAPTTRPGASQSQQQHRRAPFPHAFERWETLSSHWEGLTGYWIRKLEQNNEALEKDPISQQMARQVTDLSAAGANLFHAVVELQRLRASSERKFQRWFFDTRSELERAKEVQADLERQVRTERQARTDVFASVQKAESDKTKAEGLLREMRRELQISKEEARRAWEELGRREQEERDRTTSLRNGEPTLVGGVQVVPMIQNLPGRHTSANRPQTRTGPYPGGPGPMSMGGERLPAEEQYYEEQPESPTITDPFTETRKAPVSTIPTSQSHTGEFYQPGETNVYNPRTSADEPSYEPSASSEPGDDEYGHFHRDSTGHPTYPASMSEGSDEYEHEQTDGNGHYVPGTVAGTSAALYGGQPATAVDYSGSDWGSTWESVTPRHHHPTRLSDVLEEDEPSRTTPSRASRASVASRGFH